MENDNEKIVISEQVWAECNDLIPREEGVM